MKNLKILSVLVATFFQLCIASASDEALDKCLQAWGTHPFGSHPNYKSIAASVKIFGVGKEIKDLEETKEPTLILINTGINVMGGTRYELLNPNGWYCFKANINVMGGVKIKADCKAHLATSHEAITVMGGDDTDKSITVMGKTKIELVNCKK